MKVLAHARDMLQKQARFVEEFARPDQLTGRLRLGMTELTAMTWLARWLHGLRRELPHVSLDVAIAGGDALREGLEANRYDIVVVPATKADARFITQTIGELATVWACRAGLLDARRKTAYSLQELGEQTILFQRDQAVVQSIMQDWVSARKGPMPDVAFTNNLQALISMVLSGMGVAALPEFALNNLLPRNAVWRIPTRARAPSIPYAAMRRQHEQGSIMRIAMELAMASCDFSAVFSPPPSIPPRYRDVTLRRPESGR